MIKNVVIVLGAQQSDSAMHIHESILPQNSPPTKPAPSHWDQTSLCYTVGPWWLSILNLAVCTCWPQTPLHVSFKQKLIVC